MPEQSGAGGLMNLSTVKKLPTVEKFGLWYLRKLEQNAKLDRVDSQTYILDDDERKNINRTVRRAIRNAAVIGLISSLVTSAASYLVWPYYELSTDFFSPENIHYWKIVGCATLAASVLEIILLYHDILRKVHQITKDAHMTLCSDDAMNRSVIAALARAAMELPNPKKSDIGIDPGKETSRLKALAVSLAYKAKVSVSVFLFRSLVKRIFGRAVSRAYLEFLAIPVVAFWNAMVARKVIHEAKIRVLGPSAAAEIAEKLAECAPLLSPKGNVAVLSAVSACILSTAQLHPNLEIMFRLVRSRLTIPHGAVLDDTSGFLSSLGGISPAEQKIALKVLVFSSIIDGKLSRNEKALLERAHGLCGITLDLWQVRELGKRFRNGELMIQDGFI